ncbi:acyl carrier protein [Streptomyces sp. TRM72054]|uniref:acyl carrier protein n=1 Tax=Streptomyces TaxID=1883 RepID=UPI0014889B93|nr:MULTISPECIES: acyl carrier protein [unclassified Streptomyces]MBX9393658.1 acyl carrier protein [Streptomyces sp. TRM72054]
MNDIRSGGMASPDHDGHDGTQRGLLHAHVRAEWADALGHDDFADDDDFFEVGGHSLLIADIMAKLGALAGTRLSLRLFFDHPTVNELTDVLAADEAFGSLAR